jgi:DNA topoisomerase-1
LIETITLDEAMDLFKLPREVGEFEGSPITVAVGRFGPYLGHAKAFYSLPKTEDPYSIEYERAVEIIVEKRKEKENKLIKEYVYEEKPIQILNGRFGPYMSYNKTNIKIPKGTDPAKLTLEECVTLINNKPETPAKGRRFAKKS